MATQPHDICYSKPTHSMCHLDAVRKEWKKLYPGLQPVSDTILHQGDATAGTIQQQKIQQK